MTTAATTPARIAPAAGHPRTHARRTALEVARRAEHVASVLEAQRTRLRVAALFGAGSRTA